MLHFEKLRNDSVNELEFVRLVDEFLQLSLGKLSLVNEEIWMVTDQPERHQDVEKIRLAGSLGLLVKNFELVIVSNQNILVQEFLCVA